MLTPPYVLSPADWTNHCRDGLLGPPGGRPRGVEFPRDGGCYIEMGQFSVAGPIMTSWHRFCAKDVTLLGSWAFTANDIALGIDMLDRARDKYPWRRMQTSIHSRSMGHRQRPFPQARTRRWQSRGACTLMPSLQTEKRHLVAAPASEGRPAPVPLLGSS